MIKVVSVDNMQRSDAHTAATRTPFRELISRAGKAIFEVLKYLGIEKISFNQPKGCYYKSENPFA